jgi:thiol-disulfide isomerase/thioredoxin
VAKKSRSTQRRRARQRRPASAPASATPRPSSPASRRTALARPRTTARARTSRSWLPTAAIGAVVAAVAVIVVMSYTKSSDGGGEISVGSKQAIEKVQHVPANVLDQIGVPSDLSTPATLPSGTPPVTIDGKPAVLYVGAEYCPFCAAERWPMVVALSRFGTFSNLGTTTSSSSDVHPNTPTFTFHGASYTSPYFTFSHAETATRSGAKLESLTPEQQRLLSTYDVSAITGSDGGIPFVMIDNRYAWAGATYSPDLLDGKTFDQIATALSDPTSDVAKAIDGTANQITAMICQITGGKPSDVCSAPWVSQAQTTLGGG